MRVLRNTVGSHDNAWFDVIAAIGDPSQIQTLTPRVQNGLDRWTLRPRRGFRSTNSTDPTIPNTTITTSQATASLSPGTSGTFGTTTRTKTVAVYPVPIEKRPATDFLWQRSPFDLDSSVPPTHQEPGHDMILTYWLGRSHGLIP